MPLLGFGTWQIKGADAVPATSAALAAGYRHLDTATVYGNEMAVAGGEGGRGRLHGVVTRDLPGPEAEQRHPASLTERHGVVGHSVVGHAPIVGITPRARATWTARDRPACMGP